ncbi:MAG TPA: ABC transporter permease [Acidimicrobiales bacterium]|nr:ABC transporter permease [Acidimicrobiales bacterium]
MIGLAGQSAALDELLTGRENLELIGRLYGLDGGQRRHRAQEVLERFELTDAADRLVRTYSGGMRRRLDLGATLVGRPSVLLLDEPTAGLDPRSRNELWRFVDEVAAEGTTVVLTSQHLDEVERLAHKVAVIDHGTVIAEGSPEELKRQTGGDVLEARLVDPDDLDAGLALLTDLGDGGTQVEVEQHRISVPTSGGTRALLRAGQRLEEAGIALADLGIRRPSLDDVFFALTGHAAAEGPDPLAPTRRVSPPGEPPTRSLRTAGPAADALIPGSLARPLSDMTGITRRYLVRFARTPQLLFFGTVQPVLFVVGLSAVFGGVVEARLGGHYIQYLLPGVLVMNVLLFAGTTGVGLAEDLQGGIIDRFRSLPMARSGVLVGRTVADLVRNAASMSVIVLVGFALGFRVHASLASGLAGVLLALFFGYATSWVFAAAGLAVKDAQTAQFIGFAPVLPLVYLSGAWIPVAAMASGVRAFARNQPVNVTVEAVRTLGEGTHAYHWIWQSLAWSGGLLALSGMLAVRLYGRAAS